MWWITTWVLVSVAFVFGWAVGTRLTALPLEGPAQHIRNALQRLLAMDDCRLTGLAAQQCFDSAYERLWLALGQLEPQGALPSSRLTAAQATGRAERTTWGTGASPAAKKA